MFKNRKFKVFSILAVLLILSTVGHAAGYYKNNTYNVEHKFYDEYTNRDYNYNWQVTTYSNGWGNSSPSKPESKPVVPEKPSKPAPPVRPEYPRNQNKPSLPENQDRPSLPNDVNKPNPPIVEEKPSVPNTNLSQIELEVIRLVNIERQKNGLSAFTTSSQLSNVARVKSEDMAKNNYFSHNSPKYGSPFDMMKSFGINYNTAGENIAMGYISAQSVVNGWMNSSGHRANILNPSFKTIGVGAYTDAKGTIYWTQMFTN